MPLNPERSPANRRRTISAASSHACERRVGVEPEPVEPCAAVEAEVGAAARGEIERGCLPGELDRMERPRVQRRRAETDALGRLCDHGQRHDRRLVEEVVEDRDHVETGSLRSPRDGNVLVRPLVRLEAEADLASGEVLRSQHALTDPLDPHHHPLVRIGATDEAVLLEPVLGREPSLLRGNQRQHRLERVQTEVASRPGSARGSTRSPRSSRRPRARRPSGPRSARR